MNPEPSPPGSKRTELLRVRLSPEERRLILARAEECGKPPSTYLRHVALGCVPRARPRRLEQEAVRQLGRIGSNLTQLARVANVSGRVEESGRLDDAIEELHRTIRRLV